LLLLLPVAGAFAGSAGRGHGLPLQAAGQSSPFSPPCFALLGCATHEKLVQVQV
jgi:hypothetical protein